MFVSEGAGQVARRSSCYLHRNKQSLSSTITTTAIIIIIIPEMKRSYDKQKTIDIICFRDVIANGGGRSRKSLPPVLLSGITAQLQIDGGKSNP
ncbi:hypothetical protein LY78DRAFT_349937 [Colletotrichum sublineola]|nr:hypothetical protein LY78DRAFT_349937 [Colletotrichum sublineola]